MIYVVIDIETVENERAKEYYAGKKYFPAANLKDPAKIAQSVLEKRQKDMDSSGLYWWTGKVICICANIVGSQTPEKPLTIYGDKEKELLISFFDWLDIISKRASLITVIGKSGDYFDIPFLIGRCLAHDLGVPELLRNKGTIRDIDHIFSYSSQCGQRSTLADYAFGISAKGKLGHGSNVAGLYSQIVMGDTDKWKELYEYCARDTDIATEMLQRWLKPYTPTVTEISEPCDIPF